MKARLFLIAFIAPCALAVLVAALRYVWSIAFAPDRAYMLAVVFDRLGNAATNGNPLETVSSRAGRARAEGRRWGCILCGLLDWIDKHHCERFIEQRFIDPR